MVDHNQSEDVSDSKDFKISLNSAEILSQSLLFMMAGSETTATVLSYITYNLAMNPDCQDKLIKEIETVLEKHVF